MVLSLGAWPAEGPGGTGEHHQIRHLWPEASGNEAFSIQLMFFTQAGVCWDVPAWNQAYSIVIKVKPGDDRDTRQHGSEDPEGAVNI